MQRVHRLILLLVAAVSCAGIARAQSAEQNAADAARLIELLDLKPGMVAADVGAGGGLMTVPIAAYLGAKGRVYATDVNPQRLVELNALRHSAASAPVTVI